MDDSRPPQSTKANRIFLVTLVALVAVLAFHAAITGMELYHALALRIPTTFTEAVILV